MKVTVCQFHDDPKAFEIDWQMLVAHVRIERSDFVLLPEMPFYPWFATSRTFNPAVWNAAVAAHEEWEQRLHDLAPAVVAAEEAESRWERLMRRSVGGSPGLCE